MQRTHFFWQPGTNISSFLAVSYRAMSTMTTTFLFGPTTTQLISSTCFIIVSNVWNSCAGAAANARACTEVIAVFDKEHSCNQTSEGLSGVWVLLFVEYCSQIFPWIIHYDCTWLFLLCAPLFLLDRHQCSQSAPLLLHSKPQHLQAPNHWNT